MRRFAKDSVRRSYRLWRLAILGCSLAASLHAAEKITFKPVPLALLKVDNQQAKIWNVYEAHKKSNLTLVQLGQRFLVLDSGQRTVTELAPRMLTRKGTDLLWERKEPAPRAQNPPNKDAEQAGGVNVQPVPDVRVLETEEWDIRDRGRVRSIKVRLKDEGRTIEVQLPLPLDQRFY